MKKNSYNNFSDYLPHQPPYNLERWMKALRDIRSEQRQGLKYFDAFKKVVSSWSSKEVRDFQNWVKFYDEQAHMKYTTAQMYGYEGYYLPTAKPSVPSPVVPNEKELFKAEDSFSEENLKLQEAQKAEQQKNKRERVLEHRKKILSRLQATRKLFTTEDGKLLSGPNLGRFLDTLNELEKQIHGLEVSASVLSGLTRRSAAFLEQEGFYKQAEELIKLADNLPGGLPPEDPNASITQGGAVGNNNPTNLTQPTDQSKANPALIQFLNGLNGENPFEDNTDADDVDFEDEVDIESEDNLSVEDHEGILISEAQLANSAPEHIQKDDLEVTDEEPLDPSKDFDSLIDNAFSNLKVSDIVKKLDDLSRLFKNREIARQLSIVDMMMDKLGLSSFFPSLGEATRSALDSNQYCLVRVDEVKDRLAGAINAVGQSVHDANGGNVDIQEGGIDLLGKQDENKDPLLNQLKETLNSQQKKDKLKKDLRRSVEDKALLEAGNKQKAEVEDISEELNKENVKAPDVTVPTKSDVQKVIESDPNKLPVPGTK